jgi:hypothetical protein
MILLVVALPFFLQKNLPHLYGNFRSRNFLSKVNWIRLRHLDCILMIDISQSIFPCRPGAGVNEMTRCNLMSESFLRQESDHVKLI